MEIIRLYKVMILFKGPITLNYYQTRLFPNKKAISFSTQRGNILKGGPSYLGIHITILLEAVEGLLSLQESGVKNTTRCGC